MKNVSLAAIPNQTSTKVTQTAPDLQEQIRLRAFELYERRGHGGCEEQDWLQAESEVTKQKAKGVGA
jgi:hypothetical protein